MLKKLRNSITWKTGRLELKYTPGSVLYKGLSDEQYLAQRENKENRSMEEKKNRTKQGIFLTEYSMLQWRVTRIPVATFVSVPCFRCCNTKQYFDLKLNMSNNDFLCNKKYSVCTLAKECVLCTKMLTFFIYFAPLVPYTIKIKCIIFTIFSGLSITITLMHHFIFQIIV